MKLKTIESLDVLFTNNVNVETREIYLLDEIDDESSAKFIKALNFLASKGDEEITIFIDSPGGLIYQMLAMYDAMQNIRAPIRTIGIGHVMSAAPLLLAAGTKGRRFVAPNCHLMVHQGSDEISGKTTDIAVEARHCEKLERQWCDLMEQHTHKKAKEWRKLIKTSDHYIEAVKAIEYGLADYIYQK